MTCPTCIGHGPPTRLSTETHHAHVAGQSVFVSVDSDEGRPVRIAIQLHKEGATLRGWAETLAGVLSVALQRGVPLDVLAAELVGVRCEPAGDVDGHDSITSATSIPDYVGRALLAWRASR
jgi:hypothetical protein